MNFSKTPGDIHKSTTPATNFATSTSGVVDSLIPLVSTIPAANLPLVSMTQVVNNGNIIRLLTPNSELEGKHFSIC